MPSNLTKSQLLQAFALMDSGTLNKLYSYGQMLIIPDQDLLVNANKQQMEDWVVSNAPTYFPAWTAYYDKSDFGWYLVELMALFSEKDFWYINAFANEALLQKSHIYSIAFVKAVSLGYSPVTCQGASAVFNVTFPAGAQTTYSRGQLVISLPAVNLLFSNDDEFTINASSSPQTIPLTLSEGSQAASNVSYNGNSVILTNQNIDIESLDVWINNVDWRRVRVFGESGPSSTDYVAFPESDGSGSIQFGDNAGFGVQPNVGDAITVYFRTCSGSAGNVAQQAALISQSNGALAPIGVAMATAATGGADPESLESIKNNAILFFATKLAAINTTIVKQILNQQPGVGQSNAYAVGPNVFFQVIPSDGSVASSTFLGQLQAFLTPLLMLGYECASTAVTYVDVAPVTLTVSILKGFDVPTTVSLVSQLVTDYTDPLVLATFGGSFDLTALSLLIKAQVPGVQNVIFNIVQGSSAPATITMPNTSILQKIDPTTDLTINPIAA